MLRQGRNVASVEARAAVDGQVVTTGAFSFGAAQQSDIAVALPGPDAPPPEECDPYIPAQAAAFAPNFHHNFDLLLIEGDRPLSGSTRGYLRLWARHRDKAARGTLPGLLCLADALPPAVFPLYRKLGANSSMNWICNVLDADPQTRDGWWQMESHATGAADGYSSQHMRAWNTDGQLVLDGMQSVLVFV
jgi:acyl-CoA thioesterase